MDLLASSLSFSSSSVKVSTRIEAYSCKSVARERKLFSRLDSEFTSDLELTTSTSPPEDHEALVGSAFGPLDKKESRKTLWLLIATLNAAYPDHDFSRVKAEEFTREESVGTVLAGLNEALTHLSEPSSAYRSFASLSISPSVGGSPTMRAADGQPVAGDLPAIDPSLRTILDPVIDLAECEVYSYSPDPDSDPHAVDSDDDFDDGSVSSSVFGDAEAAGLDPTAPMWEMDELDGQAQFGGLPSYAVSHAHRTVGGLHGHISVPSTPHPSKHITAARSAESFLLPGALGSAPNAIFPSARTGLTSPSFTSAFDATAGNEESAGGLLWSTHILLYHRKKKRVLFISAWCRKLANDHHKLSDMPPVSASAPALHGPSLDAVRSLQRSSLKRSRSGAATPILARRVSNGSTTSISYHPFGTPNKKARQSRQASVAALQTLSAQS